jgi:hypothetical protein
LFTETIMTDATGKGPASRARSTRKAAPRKTAARPAAASTAKPTLAEKDSVLIAGIDRAEEQAERLRDWALIRREEAKDAVRTHPLGSSVIVFAAGMIFGLLLARR